MATPNSARSHKRPSEDGGDLNRESEALEAASSMQVIIYVLRNTHVHDFVQTMGTSILHDEPRKTCTVLLQCTCPGCHRTH